MNIPFNTEHRCLNAAEVVRSWFHLPTWNKTPVCITKGSCSCSIKAIIIVYTSRSSWAQFQTHRKETLFNNSHRQWSGHSDEQIVFCRLLKLTIISEVGYTNHQMCIDDQNVHGLQFGKQLCTLIAMPPTSKICRTKWNSILVSKLSSNLRPDIFANTFQLRWSAR